MNLREVIHAVGALLAWTAAAMLPSAVMGIVEGRGLEWVGAMAVAGGIGGLLWAGTPRIESVNPREGLVIVGLGWITIVLVGALPFLFTGVAPNIAGAVFESVSGFTTTGATIYATVEDLPDSILLWRSVTHWLGGMGIIVLGVAILPLLGMGGAQLFRAEVPGITNDRLAPRIVSTARLLWVVYAALTAILVVMYLVLGMSPFDAVNHAMSTLATGGFSTKTASMAAYSPVIQWVTLIFMVIAGTNFVLHYRFATGHVTSWIKDTEWRWYAAAAVSASLGIFVALGIAGDGWIFRDAAFNTIAIITTTGFATADFGAWPSFCQVVLLGLMFVGAMGGSTGGGFKVVRAVVVLKHAASEVRKVLHPRAVFVSKLGRSPIRSENLLNVLAFLALYVLTHGIGTLVLAALGSDIVTATSAALAAMSSIGPGLGNVGPTSHYGDLGGAAQLVLSALMLLGRLEFYTLLVLFIPGTWERSGGVR